MAPTSLNENSLELTIMSAMTGMSSMFPETSNHQTNALPVSKQNVD